MAGNKWKIENAVTKYLTKQEASVVSNVVAQVKKEAMLSLDVALLTTSVNSLETLRAITDGVDVRVVGQTIEINLQKGSLGEFINEGSRPWSVAEAMLRTHGKRAKDGTMYADVPFTGNMRQQLSPQQKSTHFERSRKKKWAMRDVTEIGQSIGQEARAAAMAETGRDKLSRANPANAHFKGRMAIRRVSRKSIMRNPGGWVHPGFQGTHIFERLQDAFNERLTAGIVDILGWNKR